MKSKRPDRIEKRKFLRQYKLERGCSECGYNKIPQALEFDHIDRSKKKSKVSKMYNFGWDALFKELGNCIILCANCHREKTMREKDYLAHDHEKEESPQHDLFGS